MINPSKIITTKLAADTQNTLPTSNQNPPSTGRISPATIKSWISGQLINATVIKQLPSNTLLLDIGSTQLTAKADISPAPGSVLQLKVMQTSEQPQLQLISSKPPSNDPQQISLAALRQVIPKQVSLNEFFTNIKTTINDSDKPLPQIIRQAVQNLQNSVATRVEIITPQGVKKAIAESGQFLEANLSTNKNVQSGLENLRSPETNLKRTTNNLNNVATNSANLKTNPSNSQNINLQNTPFAKASQTAVSMNLRTNTQTLNPSSGVANSDNSKPVNINLFTSETLQSSAHVIKNNNSSAPININDLKPLPNEQNKLNDKQPNIQSTPAEQNPANHRLTDSNINNLKSVEAKDLKQTRSIEPTRTTETNLPKVLVNNLITSEQAAIKSNRLNVNNPSLNSAVLNSPATQNSTINGQSASSLTSAFLPAITAAISNDLKGKLLQLASFITTENDKNIKQELQNPSLNSSENASKVLPDLQRQVDSALARLQFNQLNSLPAGENNPQFFLLELSIKDKENIDVLSLKIEEQTQQDQDPLEDKRWSIRLSFNLQDLGTIHAKLLLGGEQIQASVWAEEENTFSLIENNLDQLRQRLSDVKFIDPNVKCYRGKPQSDDVLSNSAQNELVNIQI